MVALQEPLVLSEVVLEYVSFVALLAGGGAVGFRWFVLRPLLRSGGAGGTDAGGRIAGRASRTAAVIGLLGVLTTLALTLVGTADNAAKKGMSLGQALMGNGGMGAIGVGLLGLAALGFVLAAVRVGAGWVLALVGVFGNALKGLPAGNLLRMVNPFHVLMASLWIGTLAVMVIAGIGVALGRDVPREDRGPAVAAMVNAFSPLALFAASFLALSGVVTAWRHLHVLSNLWTTPYGWALMVKLALVACVAALGAWNWRRVRPTLGSDEGAQGIRRSATAELTVAALVLAATAVLVSLPSPRAPKGQGGPGEGPPPQGAPAGPQQGGQPPS
ncbi:MAG: copper resistance domain protein [Gemmatimonadetes bacterium]|nr:copper resistance domain protein [Gemmatimonadota bacterium]